MTDNLLYDYYTGLIPTRLVKNAMLIVDMKTYHHKVFLVLSTTPCSRFCKDVFEKDYKATIGVDFEIERFEISGVPFSLQM